MTLKIEYIVKMKKKEIQTKINIFKKFLKKEITDHSVTKRKKTNSRLKDAENSRNRKRKQTESEKLTNKGLHQSVLPHLCGAGARRSHKSLQEQT